MKMVKSKEEMSQADLIMEYYKKHPKREIPHYKKDERQGS